ncbi:hypothetical protein AB0I72_23375 [Nocardiopsis sp. NPDC049922]
MPSLLFILAWVLFFTVLSVLVVAALLAELNATPRSWDQTKRWEDDR